ASVAVLPVLVGLAVDYAIQFQSRVGEELAGERAGGGAGAGAAAARRRGIDRAARAGGPTIATAAAASAAGMLVLLLSPVPMVRGFGVLLVVGIAIALLCAFSAGAAVITLGPSARLEGAGERLGRSRLARAGGGAGELLSDNPLTRLVTSAALV